MHHATLKSQLNCIVLTHWKYSVQFAEYREAGVGSRVKGYPRYSGKWLEGMHDKTDIVCITNEHMISQTYIYCFQKLEYPLFTQEKDREIRKACIRQPDVCQSRLHLCEVW